MGNVDELIQKYKQEAEQLSLTPDPRVWENVDREINGGKRKKRFFFIFFLLGCGLAYGLFTVNTYINGNKPIVPSSKIVAANTNNETETVQSGTTNSPLPKPSATKQAKKLRKTNANKHNTATAIKREESNIPTNAKPGIAVNGLPNYSALRPKPLVAMPVQKMRQNLVATINPLVWQASEVAIAGNVVIPETPVGSQGGVAATKPVAHQKATKVKTQRIARIPAVAPKRIAANAFPTVPRPIIPVAPPDASAFIAKPQPVKEKKAQRAMQPYIGQISAGSHKLLFAELKSGNPSSVSVEEFIPHITDTVPEPFIPLPPPYEEPPRSVANNMAPLPTIAHQQLTASVGKPVMQAALIQAPEINFSSYAGEINKDTTYAKSKDTTLRSKTRASWRNRWAVSLSAESAANNKTVSETGDYQFVKHYRDSTDKRLLSFNYSAGLHYSVSDRLRLDLGFGFNKTGERINSHQVVYSIDTLSFVKNTTIIVTSSTQVITATGKKFYDINNDSTGHINNYVSYLSVSAGFTYYLQPGKKFRIGLQPAIAASKLFSSNSYYYNNQDSTYRKAGSSQLSPWVMSATLGIPFEYNFSPRLMASATPYYSTFLTSTYTSGQTVTTQYRPSGLKLSIAWIFR